LKLTPFEEGTNLRLFKGGIKPMWEDPSNEKGGKWVFIKTLEIFVD
jgi:translation initiation factor 4E